MKTLSYTVMIVVIATCCACAHQPQTEHKPVTSTEKVEKTVMDAPSALDESGALSATDFQERVAAAAGEVAFVFEDERPFAQCHASTICQAPDGTLITAWFAGTEEKHPDVGIWMSRRANGAWEPPHRAAPMRRWRKGAAPSGRQNRGIGTLESRPVHRRRRRGPFVLQSRTGNFPLAHLLDAFCG